MTPKYIRDEIRSLKDKYNVTQLAFKFGIGRKTVRKILAENPNTVREKKPDDEGVPDITNWTGIIGRCSECGGMVKLPCLACRIESFRNKTKRVK